MGKSRSQISQQIVTLLRAVSGVFTVSASVFEATADVDDFLASGLTFPIAAVQTLAAEPDREVPGRFEVARFKIGVAGGPVTEPKGSPLPGSGGSASSQHVLENAIRDLVAALSPAPAFAFTSTLHGFQGEFTSFGVERLVVAPGGTYAVADLDVSVYDATRADT